MNIQFENFLKTEYFGDIKMGECFAVNLNTPDRIICMKTFNDSFGSRVNAVDLQDGKNLHFEDDELVFLIKAELKVRLGG